jgi:ribosomal protein S14
MDAHRAIAEAAVDGRHTCRLCGRTVALYRGTYRHATPRRFTDEQLVAKARARDVEYRRPRRAALATKQRAYRAEHAAERRAYDINYAASHREEIRATNAAYKRRLKQEQPERVALWRWRERLAAHGLTPASYDALYARQDGRCAVCRRPLTARTLHIDHSHTSGETRGLLCPRCNAGLGFFGDDPRRLRAAATYVEEARNGEAVA